MKNRNSNFYLRAIAAALFILSPFYQATVLAQTDNADIFLQQKMKELRIPGMQVAVVLNGQIIMARPALSLFRPELFLITSTTQTCSMV